jgi:multimeric flavodoxin WrbA
MADRPSRTPSLRSLVALNGSPVRGGSVDLLLSAVCAGADEAGGRSELLRCDDLIVKPCQACGPEPTSGYCVFHDDMDRVYAALESAHAVVVGSPVYFDGVSAQLKLVMDRCNCVTPLVRLASGGYDLRPKWPRTRRAVFVTACGAKHTHELAERSVRGFMKWVGAKWEETLLWKHDDNDPGSVATRPELLARARAVGRRLIESAPLDVA